MKHFIIVVTVLVFYCINLQAQSASPKTDTAKTTTVAKKPAVKPTMKFVSESHDFGNVTADSNVTHTFKFKNTGKTPITIFSAKGSCGCTQVVADTKPIKPGETSLITVTYHASASGEGKFTKLITVLSNADIKIKKLSIHGNIMPKK
jgi:hypothetical protein